jgi:hypothetical protein
MSKTSNMTIHIYAQHTGRAGQLCQDDDLIERGSDDVWTLEGSPEELRAVADARAKGKSSFDWRVARTIRQELRDS